jgi:hypothetical protein
MKRVLNHKTGLWESVCTVACGFVARQRLGSDHVGIPTGANATMDTATEEWCFLCDPCREVINRTVGAMS